MIKGSSKDGSKCKKETAEVREQMSSEERKAEILRAYNVIFCVTWTK